MGSTRKCSTSDKKECSMNSAAERRQFISLLAEEIQQCRNDGRFLALAVVDVRNFSRINLRHGYSVGDLVLELLGQRCAMVVKRPEHSLRIDGDKFALILTPILSEKLLPLVASKITKTVSEPLEVGDLRVEIGAGTGITSTFDDSGSAEQMLAAAEQMAKRAKARNVPYMIEQSTRNREYFNNGLLEEAINRALETNGFEMFYQPKVGLQDGCPRSAEGLLRWRDDDNNFVRPDKVIETIENAGKMVELYNWELNTALRQASQWSTRFGPIPVAINMSASCLTHPYLFEMVESCLNIWGGDPSLLCIEVTESVVQEDVNKGVKVLERISQLGVKISIDDFGTGYSSIEYFKYIPANEIKVDQSFVQNMFKHPVDLEIVKLVQDWGRRFKLTTVAEGVEDRETTNMLKEIGYDLAQGYHFSKALESEEFSSWLEAFDDSRYF